MSTAIYHGMLDDVRQAQKGDEAAFTRLVNKTKNTVTSIALAIVKDIDASEDIAQQVYIKSWQNLSSLKSTTSFLPWLRQMTRNFACNFIRDNRVNQQIIGADAEKILAEYSCESDRQQEQLERSQLSVIISDLIEQLPEDSREMILL